MASPNKTPAEKRICLGKITGAHGVKGLVKILPFGEDLDLLNGTLYTDESTDSTIHITLKNPIGKYMIAEIEGVHSRDDAEKMKTSLFISRDALPDIDENEFYIEDLKGLKVLDTNKNEIGSLIAVQNYGAGDLLEIKPASGASYFVPFQDEYVRDINLDEQYIIVKNAEHFIIE